MKLKFFDNYSDSHAHTACLNYGLGAYPFVRGYKEAADILVIKLSETSGHSIDGLVYPICYLYRHHIEIFLKDIIRVCGQLYDFDEVGSFLEKKSHSLSSLWNKLRKLLNDSGEYSEAIAKELNPFNNLVNEISQFDPLGTSFRYHKDINGKTLLKNPATEDPVKHCDVFALYNEMQNFSQMLECLDMDLNAKLNFQMECIQEMQAY